MEIREDILTKHLAEAAIEQLEADYARQGFELTREATFGGISADLVARKGGETLVFQVKSGAWTPAKREEARQLRNHAVQQEGARFILVLADQPRRDVIEVRGIEAVLHSVVESHCRSALGPSVTHSRVGEILEVDFESIVVGSHEVTVKGSAAVELELQYSADSDQMIAEDVTVLEVVPLRFHLRLAEDLSVKEVVEVRLELDDLGA